MSVYVLSEILNNDFTSYYTEQIPVENVLYNEETLTFSSTGKKGHYGLSIFSHLDKLLPSVWRKTTLKEADVNNTNSSKVVWYLDGIETFTFKHNLKDGKFAIKEKDPSLKNKNGETLYIQKPSHLYIGSGKLITIGSDVEKMVKNRPKTYKLFPKADPVVIDHWVLQPLVKSSLWEKKYKFDTRFYAVIFNIKSNIYVWSYKYGVGRIAVNFHDPEKDYASAITNISVQETLKGYNKDKHLPLIYDNINIVSPIMRSVIKDFSITEQHHVVILGLDIIFLEDGTPRVIEVNHEPFLEIFEEGNEKICSMGVINTVFGNIIPHMLQDVLPQEESDWNVFMV